MFSQLRKRESVLRLKDRHEKFVVSRPKAAIEDLKLTSSFYDRNRAGGRNPDRHPDRHAPRQQVIVSTCDQNLYLLMIRKFRVIGKEGIRFRGISLLENGSNAPEVVYNIGGPGVTAAVA